ncbi:hypothetical protein PV11_05810 [Exophiala sideris]|uniref:DSBA-like thioredoxin domain-containing protein n=1 Tax=Exophiala sideris TaxID=1016849 RepID=A0A0D1X7K2_9EURO|nr:hypothetical protein PV11_05810 [Exophiala sideris]
MTYESQISFTLDTICPWTYLAKKRLDEALRRFRQSDDANGTTFVVKYFPYQLNPDASKDGEDKYAWYKKSRYADSEEKMKMYITLMTAYGKSAGINFKFGGTVSNTLDAHRVIQHFQEEKGPEVADKIINCRPALDEMLTTNLSPALYSQYFENERDPASTETLLQATADAGISESEAKAVVEDKNDGLRDVKMLIREQATNGVDSVPYVTLEGKRRDFTLVGAKEVEEYEKVLHQVVKESK